jgi:hypothetical protein
MLSIFFKKTALAYNQDGGSTERKRLIYKKSYNFLKKETSPLVFTFNTMVSLSFFSDTK